MITGINTIRNGIENGYPFVESILSLLPLVDEYLINDGGSTDGTLQTLRYMREVYPKITLYEIPDKPSTRWDCVSDVLNHLIKQARGDWVIRTDADELLHERDIPFIRRDILKCKDRIMRFDRREIVDNWSRLTQDRYAPARAARRLPGLRQDWSAYGGDEFLYGDEWVDPDRKLAPKHVLYHLYAVFPENLVNKRRNDAEWLAPGDEHRVRLYKEIVGSGGFEGSIPREIYQGLPALAKHLVTMTRYTVLPHLFDVEWLWRATGHDYES